MKHFIYEDSKISVEMPIVCGITLIHGNSGTGKSYVCDRVRRAQSDPGIIECRYSKNLCYTK